jgi:hypothetical protein
MTKEIKFERITETLADVVDTTDVNTTDVVDTTDVVATQDVKKAIESLFYSIHFDCGSDVEVDVNINDDDVFKIDNQKVLGYLPILVSKIDLFFAKEYEVSIQALKNQDVTEVAIKFCGNQKNISFTDLDDSFSFAYQIKEFIEENLEQVLPFAYRNR